MSLWAKFGKDGPKGDDGVVYKVCPEVGYLRKDANDNITPSTISCTAKK